MTGRLLVAPQWRARDHGPQRASVDAATGTLGVMERMRALIGILGPRLCACCAHCGARRWLVADDGAAGVWLECRSCGSVQGLVNNT